MTDTIPDTLRNLSDARRFLVDFALGLDGLAADPHDVPSVQRYIALVAPDEEDRRTWEMLGESDCGLVGAGELRSLMAWLGGRCPPLLVPPYKAAMALDNFHKTALAAGAVRDGKHPVTAGDFVHLGASGAACEHLYLVTRRQGNDVWSIDGGERRPEDRVEIIEAKRRTIVNGFDTLSNFTRRPILAIYDLDAIAAFYDNA